MPGPRPGCSGRRQGLTEAGRWAAGSGGRWDPTLRRPAGRPDRARRAALTQRPQVLLEILVGQHLPVPGEVDRHFGGRTGARRGPNGPEQTWAGSAIWVVGGPEMCVLRRQGALGAATAGLQARTEPAGGSTGAVAPPLSAGRGRGGRRARSLKPSVRFPRGKREMG